jgi:hypothetical protein
VAITTIRDNNNPSAIAGDPAQLRPALRTSAAPAREAAAAAPAAEHGDAAGSTLSSANASGRSRAVRSTPFIGGDLERLDGLGRGFVGEEPGGEFRAEGERIEPLGGQPDDVVRSA